MFVVAKINFIDNVLTQERKRYPSLQYAYMYEAMHIDNVVDENDGPLFIEEIKQRYFDCDMTINILEVPD